MIGEFYGIITLCTVIASMSRWSRRYISGIYSIKGQPDADEAFFGHLVLGVIWPLGIAYLIGSMQHNRALEAERRRKELAAAEARADRILALDEHCDK